MKTYPLSMTRNYVAQWGVAAAVRELIQNSLDSERPFVYEFEPDGRGTAVLALHSAGVVLGPEMLLLGKTGKAGDPMAIGQFGEGFKLALLVLTRENHPVVIRNGHHTWRPRFERSDLFGGEEQLVIHEFDAGKSEDLTFEVYGLTQEEVDQIVASCLLMQAAGGSKIVTPIGDVLLERPGVLYVGNLYVCNTSMKHGYNILPDRIKLDRDRRTVDGWSLGMTTLRMWYETRDWDRIAAMIDDETPDVVNARYDGDIPEELRKACYERFRKEHPTARVAASSSEMAKLERLGSRAIRVNSGMYQAITTYDGYRSSMPDVVEKMPQERLQDYLNKWRSKMTDDMVDEFNAILDEAKDWSDE